MQVEFAIGNVDLDNVVIFDQRNRLTRTGLRADAANTGAGCHTGKTAICNQCGFLFSPAIFNATVALSISGMPGTPRGPR